ncbi:hypothetical protein HPB50_006715 [Hyalomma asiaticum]|uniref:Uncharacterized protein n=1 Tax=Hyalomma asiaticum TaxID=266040 RepID=A0ACB7RQV7_HYAAI|nr:hypothetical protein HPB50_006715 [Hyalomma asiaticum]
MPAGRPTDFSPVWTPQSQRSPQSPLSPRSPLALYKRLVSPRAENSKRPAHRIGTVIAAASAVLLVASVLAAVVVLFAHWGGRKHDRCTSPACNQFAKLLNDSVDWSANPCRDFDAYVCSGWRSKRKYSVSTELIVRAVNAMSQVVSKDPPTEEAHSTGQDFLRKASLFYRSCDVVWRGDRDELPVIREFLLRAGVAWPRRSAAPNVRRTLISLSVEFDWPVGLQVITHTQNTWIRIPYSFGWAIQETRLLGDSPSKQRSFDFLKAKFSAGDSGVGAVTFPETDELESTFYRPLSEVTTSGEIKLLNANSLEKDKWVEALAEYNVTEQTIFLSDSARYVEKFVDLWREQGEARTHLFVSWMAARYVSLFANRELVFNYYSTTNPDTVMHRHGRFCYALAYKFIGDYLFAPYNARVFLPVRQDVERIVLTIRNEFATRLSLEPPYSTDTSANISWSSLDVVMKALNQTADHSEEAKRVADTLLPDMNISFAQNWHAAWQASRSRKGGLVPRTLGWQTITSLSPYTRLRDDFVLAPYILSFPLYEPTLVDAVKYGSFGAVVAGASAHMAFTRYGRSNASAGALEEARRCIESGDKHAATTLHDLASLSILVGAFEKYGSHETLVCRFTAHQLLFASWCFQKCRGLSEALGNECNAAVRHLAAFSSAFGCSRSDHLNPERKCVVF